MRTTPSPKFLLDTSSREALGQRELIQSSPGPSMAIEVFMPGQSRESRETKYRIAETAMGMFLDQGYDSVTVEAVAEASEVSRRTVFRLYRSKDELPFPDHPERLARLEQLLESADQSDDPIEVVIAATEDSLRGFLSRPQIVLARYQLTRVVPELREREIVEHERYIRLTSAFLRSRLPLDSRPFQAPGLAALVDAMHRTALGNWARSGESPTLCPRSPRGWHGCGTWSVLCTLPQLLTACSLCCPIPRQRGNLCAHSANNPPNLSSTVPRL
ncbi:TetR/AcrR family transcriptional regulator [Dietzia aerolata]|uniref:TetR/AcrR family transcriptional regulator n=1 Tax=Dietzia aerolata TaxID=595984 RepID=UPI0036346B20